MSVLIIDNNRPRDAIARECAVNFNAVFIAVGIAVHSASQIIDVDEGGSRDTAHACDCVKQFRQSDSIIQSGC